MSRPTLPDTPEAMLDHLRSRSVDESPFTAFLGIELIRSWAGEAELIMPIRPDLTQHRGTLHGGVIGSLADNVCGFAVATIAGAVVTSSYTVHLLAPAVGGRIRAVAKTVRAGGRLATATADLFVESGDDSTLVATALATFVLVR